MGSEMCIRDRQYRNELLTLESAMEYFYASSGKSEDFELNEIVSGLSVATIGLDMKWHRAVVKRHSLQSEWVDVELVDWGSRVWVKRTCVKKLDMSFDSPCFSLKAKANNPSQVISVSYGEVVEAGRAVGRIMVSPQGNMTMNLFKRTPFKADQGEDHFCPRYSYCQNPFLLKVPEKTSSRVSTSPDKRISWISVCLDL